MYKCSKCGIEVVVVKNTGEIIKPCSCNEKIIAQASAEVHGVATVK